MITQTPTQTPTQMQTPKTAIRSLFVAGWATKLGQLPSAVQYAVSMAAHLEAHLTARVMAIHVNAPFSMAPGFVGSITEQTNVAEMARAENTIHGLTDLLQARSILADAQLIKGEFNELVAIMTRMAKSADVNIVSSSAASLIFGRNLLEEFIFNTGRPAIIVPDGAVEFVANNVLIAWDGSSRAARAVHDALPLLLMAKTIEIATITNEKDISNGAPAEDIAAALARHGIHATTTSLSPPDHDAGKAILNHAAATKVNMIVMGAFARSWLRQLVLGGVTNALLDNPPVPLFMSH